MRGKERGFTLMELMVVIVIVAILAAVAVPLYINYVKDAQRTEAKGAIGAIITAEQTYFQRFNNYLDYTTAQFTTGLTETDPRKRLDCDIREAMDNWTFAVDASDATKGIVVTATGATGKPTLGLAVTYTLHPAAGDQPWVDK